MGATNYSANKYITLGLNTNEIEIYLYYDDENYYIDDYELINYYDELNSIVNKYDFNYFTLSLEHGYYDGFYLKIDDKDYIYFDNTTEKNEVLKEATTLKKLLIKLSTCGLVACHPGWCTTYLNEEETKKEIKKAIKEIKSDLQKIPTYKIFQRNGGFKQWLSVNQ